MHRSPAPEAIIADFERAWQRGEPPSLAAAWQPVESPAARQWLAGELIAIDLEYRWRHADETGPRGPRSLDDYALLWPGGTAAGLPAALIAEEYRARRNRGEVVAPEEYLRRFPTLAGELRAWCSAIDREIAAEAAQSAPIACASRPPLRPRVPDPRATLRYADYRLLQLLGSGHTGRVYRTREYRSGRTVAVKFLRKRLLADVTAVERFVRESEILQRLTHPGVVAVHGLGGTPCGGYFQVLDYVGGGDLARRSRAGPVPVPLAVEWVAQAAAALAYVHEQGILHCDLKPGNLLLDEAGRVRIADFGLACSLEEAGWNLARLAGTAPFMAPEQAASAWGTLSQRTDVYGLGACCYALLTGRAPHEGDSLGAILSRVASAVEVPALERWRPDVPPALVRACRRALAKSPADRFASALEFQEAVCSAIGGTVALASGPPADGGRDGVRPRRAHDGA